MAIAKQDILDAIGSMSVLELSQLIKDMEEKFGVSAAAATVAVAAPGAGGGAAAAAAEEKTEFTVILTAALLLYQIALPHMKREKWGRVINMASRAGRTLSAFGAGHYSSSKAGLIGLTRVMAYECARSGITANCIAPGPIMTGITTHRAEIQEAAKNAIPVGRYGHASEVAAAVGYLASEAAGSKTLKL